MKKLIIGMAIAFSAIASQAASAGWSVMNIQGPSGGVGAADWLVQIYASTTSYKYDDAKAGTITALDGQLSVKTSATATTFKASGSGIGSYDPGAMISWYAVIYDASTVAAADHYIVSAVQNKTVPMAGGDPTLAFGNMALTTTANYFKDSTWQSVPSGDVPEPTSAMLLLLGVAGLALKRRNA